MSVNTDKLKGEGETIVKALNERIRNHNGNKKAAQDKVHLICEGLKKQVDELEIKLNEEIEELFLKEDNRLQTTLNSLCENTPTDISQVVQEAKAELLVVQSYEVVESNSWESMFSHIKVCELKTTKHLVPEVFDVRKPTNIRDVEVSGGRIYIKFTSLNPAESRIFSKYNITNPIKYRCLLRKKEGNRQDGKEYPLEKDITSDRFMFSPMTLETGVAYEIRVKTIFGNRESKWSDGIEFTPEFSENCCAWKECSASIFNKCKYSLDDNNPRIASKIQDKGYCTIIGDAPLPLNKVTSWSVKILKSKKDDSNGIYIGVAPSDINQNDDNANYNKCGWYLDCHTSSLCSGPPHNYKWPGKKYGPRKEDGEYAQTGDSVGVAMDTAKGELSFIFNGVNYGIAYEGIPLEKPLVPCVLLYHKGDSVELDLSGVEETEVNSFIPVISVIATRSDSWDSITLSWDNDEDISFYQIEVDGSKSLEASSTSTFTKRGFLIDTEHSFRVRAVRGNSVSEWSDAVIERTQGPKDFSECVWKECPDNVDDKMKYSVDPNNFKIATKMNDYTYHCTIIGNAPLPPDSVTSWNIKILKSLKNDGSNIFVGIVPSDVDQDKHDNNNKYGWYYDCYHSTLCSGPPHNSRDKAYGPMKEKSGDYVHTGSTVGVVMDTTKGELSFVVGNANLGVAYEGVPLDKPLVPCVILAKKGDSVGINLLESGESCVIS